MLPSTSTVTLTLLSSLVERAGTTQATDVDEIQVVQHGSVPSLALTSESADPRLEPEIVMTLPPDNGEFAADR